MSNRDGASSNGGLGGQHSCPSVVQVGNVFDFANHSGIVTETTETSTEAVLHHGLNTSRGFDDLVLASSARGRSVLTSGQVTEDLFLNALRSFILAKGGFLGEGWHVEFIQSPYEYGPKPFALYCAPDGKKFESMYDVADYLGISSGFTPVELDERSDGVGSAQRALPPRRRKKDLARISATSKFTNNQETVRVNSRDELCSGAEFVPQCYDVKSASRVANSYMEDNGVDEYQNLSVSIYTLFGSILAACMLAQFPRLSILLNSSSCEVITHQSLTCCVHCIQGLTYRKTCLFPLEWSYFVFLLYF